MLLLRWIGQQGLPLLLLRLLRGCCCCCKEKREGAVLPWAVRHGGDPAESQRGPAPCWLGLEAQQEERSAAPSRRGSRLDLGVQIRACGLPCWCAPACQGEGHCRAAKEQGRGSCWCYRGL